MKIFAVSTTFNGNEVTRQLLELGTKIDGIICLSETASREGIAGFESPEYLCKRFGIKFLPMDSYNLNSSAAKELLKDIDIDVALIVGWQRLVPDWFLRKCSVGAIGVHGSAVGITGGRGRSPQNWALILGKEEFHLSIFFADPGIDSGPIIDSQSIPLTIWDDIRTSHLKIGRATVDMIQRNIDNGHISKRICTEQNGEVRYLPQRRPEDGQIDWTRSSREIYDFVRGLTKPYPGAYSPLPDQGVLRIWTTRPFIEDLAETNTAEPGTILDRFENGEYLIKTGDGRLFVDAYDIEGRSEVIPSGLCLESCSFSEQMQTIALRHKSKYPGMPLVSELERFVEKL